MTDSFLDIEATTQREGQLNEQRAFAQLYVDAFVNNASGAQILAHWNRVYARKRTPVNAPLNEFVWNESRREFLQALNDQIEFARTGRMT